jgi:hypothetical protein
MKSQKEAVYNAVINTCEPVDGAYAPTKEQKQTIYAIVTEGLVNGEVTLSDNAKVKYDTEEKIRKEYVPGLTNNWLNKDPNLNGGVKYQAKNPGSRAGSGDKVVKALKTLRSTYASDSAEYKAITVKVDARVETLRAEKAKSSIEEVDMSLIPDDLKEALGL